MVDRKRVYSEAFDTLEQAGRVREELMRIKPKRARKRLTLSDAIERMRDATAPRA